MSKIKYEQINIDTSQVWRIWIDIIKVEAKLYR